MSPGSTGTQFDIFAALQQLSHEVLPFTLTRYFDGLLLQLEVELVSLLEETAHFWARDLKIIAAPGGRRVHLLHTALPKPLKARLYTCDVHRCRFVLTDFGWVQRDWLERSQERVPPKTPMYVSLDSREDTIPAALLDLNAGGMGLLVRRSPQHDPVILAQTRVQLHFQSGPPWKCSPLRGTIVYIEPVNRCLLRVGIHLHPSSSQTRILAGYTTQRKAQILETLDDAYRRTIEPRRVEDLYF
jgi:hypothetical protein